MRTSIGRFAFLFPLALLAACSPHADDTAKAQPEPAKYEVAYTFRSTRPVLTGSVLRSIQSSMGFFNEKLREQAAAEGKSSVAQFGDRDAAGKFNPFERAVGNNYVAVDIDSMKKLDGAWQFEAQLEKIDFSRQFVVIVNYDSRAFPGRSDELQEGASADGIRRLTLTSTDSYLPEDPDPSAAWVVDAYVLDHDGADTLELSDNGRTVGFPLSKEKTPQS